MLLLMNLLSSTVYSTPYFLKYRCSVASVHSMKRKVWFALEFQKRLSDLDGHRRILPRHVAENSLGEIFICNRCLNGKIAMKAAGSYVCELLVLQSQFFLTSISLPMSFSSYQLAYPLSSLIISNNVKRIFFLYINHSGINLNGATTTVTALFVLRFIIKKDPSIEPSLLFSAEQLV